MNKPDSHVSRSALLRLCVSAIIGACIFGACALAPVPAEQAATAQSAAKPTPVPAPTLIELTPLAIATATAVPEPMPDFLAMPTLARGYLTTPNEIRRIAWLARNGVDPYSVAVKSELGYAKETLGKDDLKLPKTINIDDDINNPPYLSTGSKYVYAWALAYNLLKDTKPDQAEEYAQRAHTLIMGMPEQGTKVKDYESNTRLNISVYTQNFVYAADLLADWTPPDQSEPFAKSADAQKFKQWLGSEIIRYPYNAAHTRVNNWSAWARLTTAVIADYVGADAPLFVQGMVKNADGAYEVDPETPCDSGETASCAQVDAHAMYADALQLHIAMVDGNAYEFSFSSCDGSGSKSMIRPDGGIPDELRRQYECDTTSIADPYGAAARYSQFAVEAMTSLAELAWRRGDSSIYTHIDPATSRGALWRAVQFMINNNVTLTRGSMLEMVNRFYTYQVSIEKDDKQREEYQKLLSTDLPGFLKRQGDWPEGAAFVSFGTLTHGFAAGETLAPPPTVAPR